MDLPTTASHNTQWWGKEVVFFKCYYTSSEILNKFSSYVRSWICWDHLLTLCSWLHETSTVNVGQNHWAGHTPVFFSLNGWSDKLGQPVWWSSSCLELCCNSIKEKKFSFVPMEEWKDKCMYKKRREKSTNELMCLAVHLLNSIRAASPNTHVQTVA